MKAITVYQPHALLLALSVKQIETRFTPIPERFIGQDFIIHAGKDTKSLDQIFGHLAYFRQHYQKLEYDSFLWHFVEALKDAYPDEPSIKRSWFALGAAIAVGTLVECASAAHFLKTISPRERMFGLYDGDKPRYGWRFENVRMFAEPFPCRGNQFIWELNIQPEHHLEF